LFGAFGQIPALRRLLARLGVRPELVLEERGERALG
jgi:hypothetical protein